LRKLKKIIEVYLPQVFLIVFSVVLGMYLNQKMLERNDRKKADKLLSMVEAEVKSNQRILKDWYPYHQRMYQKLDSLKDDSNFIKDFQKDKNVLFEKLLTRGSFMKESLSDASWEVTKLNPVVSEISFDKMNILTKVYNQQKGTFEPMHKMFDLLSKPFINTPKNAKENLNLISGFVRELAAREAQLLYYYKKADELLEGEEIKVDKEETSN